MPARPLVPAWLRGELAAGAGRWLHALGIAAAATAALLLALWAQFATFPAPLLAFKTLQPTVVNTWRLLLFRVGVIAAGAALLVVLIGFVVQLPWLLLPVFFTTLTVLTYVAPIRQSPITGYCLALTVGGITYNGIFTPEHIPGTALTMVIGFAIGLVVATVVAGLRATPASRDLLAAALAASFAASRDRLAALRGRLRAEAPAAVESPSLSALPRHLQLLGLMRMEGDDAELTRACVVLITVAERLSLFIPVAEHHAACLAAAPDAGAELDALLAAADRALQRFIAAARQPQVAVVHGGEAPADWPDFRVLGDAVRERLHAPGAASDRALSGITGLHDFIQAVDGIADALHTAPEALEHLPGDAGPAPPRRLLGPFDPYAAQYALKVSAACTLALVVGIGSHVKALETIVLNPLILAQGSYGATLRKAWQRLGGVLAGGLLAILTSIVVMPNTGDVTVWLACFFAVMAPCAYVSLGSVRINYVGVQIAATYMIVLVANHPVVDVHEALWRFYGTVLGALILFGVFLLLVPDYAGRQLVSRFADLLALSLRLAPPPGEPGLTAARASGLRDQVIAGLADILRLAEEARFEGGDSGVAPDDAVEAAAILRRVTHRYALLRRARHTAPLPPLPAAVAAARTALETAARDLLARLGRMTAARHHRARTGSRRHRAAVAAATAVAATPPPDLAAAWRRLQAAVDADRPAVTGWPRAALDAWLAELGHLQRLAELLPKLDAALQRALLHPAR